MATSRAVKAVLRSTRNYQERVVVAHDWEAAGLPRPLTRKERRERERHLAKLALDEKREAARVEAIARRAWAEVTRGEGDLTRR